MRAFRATGLLARVSAAAIICALGGQGASAHTVSIGYTFVGPGSVSLWYGSYHGSSTFNEADVQLVGPSYNQTIAFSLLANVKPAGLIDGSTNFYSNTAGTMLVGIPEFVTSTDGSGGSFNPATQSILNWQGATFNGLAPGTYTFTYNPLATPTVEWHPINEVIETNTFTLTMADVLGINGFGGLGTSQNQINVGNAIDNSINSGNFNQNFYNLASLPQSQIPGALSQLSGEPLTQIGNAGFQSMNAFLATMLDPWGGAGTMDLRGGDFGAASFAGGAFGAGDPSSHYGNAPYGTDPYGAAPYGSAPYGSAPYGNSPYGNSPYGSSPYGNSPYGNSPYGSSPYGSSPYGNSPYGNSQYGSSPYGSSQYGNSPYGNSPYGNSANRDARSGRQVQPYCAPTPDGRTSPCWSIWATPYGGYSTMSGSALPGSHDTTVKSAGMISGIDYRFSPGGVVGAAMAAGSTWWGLSDNLGGGRSDSFQFGGYASQRFYTAYVSAAGAFGWQQVATNRNITISGGGELGANFTAYGAGARAETGNRFAYGETGVTPHVAVQFQRWNLPGYTESASTGSNDFAISVNARKANSTRIESGIWIDRSLDTELGRLQLRGRMAWLHEMKSSAVIDAAFPAMPNSNFTVTGASNDPNALLMSYAAELRVAGGWSVGSKFDAELARDSKSFGGSGTVRYRW